MTNKDKVLAAISNQGLYSGICDDCLEAAADVHPRQQVNQICRRLASEGVIARRQGNCVAADHRMEKELNFVGRDFASKERAGDRDSSRNILPNLAKQTDDLSQWLYDAGKFIDRLGHRTDPKEPFAAVVNRLKREGLIPASLSSIMQLLNTYRVQVVKERQALDADSWHIANQSMAKSRAEWKKLELN